MTGRHSTPAARGLALVAVLWLVVALGLAMVGLSRAVRDEARNASLQAGKLRGIALADAAILQILQRLQAEGRTSLARPEQSQVMFAGQSVTVQVAPANGRINLQLAPPSLLRDLFVHGAGMDAAAAQRWADAVVAWRNRPGPQGQPGGIDAPEELLQLSGFPYDGYDRVRALSYSSNQGAGVNPLAASPGVLAVLFEGQTARASAVHAARFSATTDFSGINPAHLDTAATSRLLVTALVPLGDGGTISRQWMVQMAAGARSVPWRVISARETLLPAS